MKTIRVVAAVICDSMQEKYKIYATARGGHCLPKDTTGKFDRSNR